MLIELNTYGDLLDYLKTLSFDKLNQPIQITRQGDLCLSDIITLLPGIAIGTVDDMEFFGSRSVVDNQYHGEEIVILTDANLFGKDGALAYEHKDGKCVPLYGPKGPTSRDSQLNPKETTPDTSSSEAAILKNRLKKELP